MKSRAITKNVRCPWRAFLLWRCRLLHKYTLFSCCTIIMLIYLAAIMLPIRMPGTEHVVGYISSKPLLRITLCSVNKRYRSLLQYWSKTSAYSNDNILLTTSAALDLDIRRLEGSFVSTTHYCSTLTTIHKYSWKINWCWKRLYICAEAE